VGLVRPVSTSGCGASTDVMVASAGRVASTASVASRWSWRESSRVESEYVSATTTAATASTPATPPRERRESPWVATAKPAPSPIAANGSTGNRSAQASYSCGIQASPATSPAVMAGSTASPGTATRARRDTAARDTSTSRTAPASSSHTVTP
jgi:hypothetical protein